MSAKKIIKGKFEFNVWEKSFCMTRPVNTTVIYLAREPDDRDLYSQINTYQTIERHVKEDIKQHIKKAFE